MNFPINEFVAYMGKYEKIFFFPDFLSTLSEVKVGLVLNFASKTRENVSPVYDLFLQLDDGPLH